MVWEGYFMKKLIGILLALCICPLLLPVTVVLAAVPEVSAQALFVL